MSKKIIIITILAIMLIAQFSSIIYASTIDTSKTASLTIIEYENAYGTDKDSSQNVPLPGVEITIYKINDENYNMSATQLESQLSDGTINLPSQTLTTGTDGKIQFANLELGRYLVVQTNSPTNVSVKMESFLIDLPMTSNDGTNWIYDVTVEPKNTTVYGDVTLTCTDKNLEPIQKITWELQFKNSSNIWEKYDYSGYLSTDANGQIKITNLPVGNYRFIETSTPLGYILDISNVQEFEISAENPSALLNTIVDKPTVNTQVQISDGYGKAVGADSTDSVDWKITADIPTIISKMNTFYVTNTIPSQLDLIENSLVVYADETPLTPDTDYTLTINEEDTGKVLKIDFIKSDLKNYNSVYFTYQTKFNSSINYGTAITNKAKLTYTNILDINQNCLSYYTSNLSTAEVHTGALTIKKVDSAENPLSGAKFKISKSKEDAQNNIFIKDPINKDNDLIATSDNEGYLTFYGLKYGNDNESAYSGSTSYFLTEIESPTYEENGETKHYQLLADSVEVSVNSYSGNKNDYTTKVVNKKSFDLPVTGAAGSFAIILIGAFFLLLAIVRVNKDENEEIKKN